MSRRVCETWEFPEAANYTMPNVSNLDVARHYPKAIEAGDAQSVLSLFSPEAMVEQLPNRIYPKGARAGISEVPAAFEKGRKIFSQQTYEILNTVETGTGIALGTLERHLGNPLRHANRGR